MTTDPEEVSNLTPQILSLVSAFLSEQGLESTQKTLRKELKKKKRTTDLDVVQEGVSLQKIVDSWKKKELEARTKADTSDESSAEGSSSGSESSSTTSSKASGKNSSSEAEPESYSDDSSDEEEVATKHPNLKRVKVDIRNSLSSTTSSPDSDANDEDESENETASKTKPAQKKSLKVSKQTEPIPNFKRKAASSLPNISASTSSSGPSDNDRPAKRVKVNANGETSSSEASTSTSDQSSSAEETSSSEEEQESEKDTVLTQPKSLERLISAGAEAPSDDASSNTVMGDVMDPARTSSGPEKPGESESRQVVSNSKRKLVPKQTHIGATPTPLAQLSAQATADAHISNAYQSYEYAERAYNDLSVTRGKGFTKEKNKKKRGSYRGGTIDIGGGKGFKFDD